MQELKIGLDWSRWELNLNMEKWFINLKDWIIDKDI